MNRPNHRPAHTCVRVLLLSLSASLLAPGAVAVPRSADPPATPAIPPEQAPPTASSAGEPAPFPAVRARLFRSAWAGELRKEPAPTDKVPEVKKLDFTFLESGLLVANDRKTGQGELFGDWSLAPDDVLTIHTRDKMTYSGRFDSPSSISGSAAHPRTYYAHTLQTIPRYEFSLAPSKARRLTASVDVAARLSVRPGQTACGNGRLTGRAIRNTVGSNSFQSIVLPPAQEFTFKVKRMTQHGKSMAPVKVLTQAEYIDVEFCLTAPSVMPSPHPDAVLIRFDFGLKGLSAPEISASSTYLSLPVHVLPD